MTQEIARAEVVIGDGQPIPVQFNPASLQVEITNSISQQGEAGATHQVSTQSSAKLGLDLLFDTTATGEDVRNRTRPLRAAVRAPTDASGGAAPSDASAAFVPPRVSFQWGTFLFAGIAESFRETLDFFSSEGVPLRAQIAISLKEQPNEFTAFERPSGGQALETPAAGGAAGVAARGGDRRAARAIAGANGEASLRFAGGATLGVPRPGGLLDGLSRGVGAGVQQAFANLGGAPRSAPPNRFDAQRLAPKPAPSAPLATDRGAGFGVDGRALPRAGSGLRSDVGQGLPLSSRLRFGE
jgi:hypothetical protein